MQMNKSQRRKLLRSTWKAIKYLQPDADITASLPDGTSEVLCAAGDRIQKKAINRAFELEQEGVFSNTKWRVVVKKSVDFETLMLSRGTAGLNVNAISVSDGFIHVPQSALVVDQPCTDDEDEDADTDADSDSE